MTPQRRRLVQVACLALAATSLGVWLRQDYHHSLAKLAATQAKAQLIECGTGDAGPTGIVLTTAAGTVALALGAADGNAVAEVAGSPRTWRIIAPIHTAADQDTVAAFLSATCSLRRVGFVRAKANEPALDLALFGLASPPQHLTLTTGNGATQTLAFGDRSSFDNSLFVRVGDATDVERIDGAYSHQLARDLFAWRDKRALAISTDAIAQIAVRSERNQVPPFALLVGETPKAGEGAQQISVHEPDAQGDAWPADGAQAQELLQAVAQVRAQSIVVEHPQAQELTRFGLAPPKALVTVTPRQGPPRVLRLGSITLGGDAHHFLQVDAADAPVMQLPGDWLMQKLTRGGAGLRDMRVLHVLADSVQAVVLHDGGKTLRLERIGAADDSAARWRLSGSQASDGNQALDDDSINTRLHHLLHMRAAKIVARAATESALHQAGLTAPRRHIEFFATGDRPLATLWLGHSDANQVFVTDDKKSQIFTVFVSTLDALPLDAASYAKGTPDSDAAPVKPTRPTP